MEYIICDISAWDFWRTPPVLRDVEIPLEIALCDQPDGLGLDWPHAVPRQNARQLDLIIRERLLTDLKGVTPPVHMMLPEGIRYSSELITAHRIPKDLPREWAVDIGGNIGVLSPAFLLANSPYHADPVILALGMCEACGIYATSPQNSRIQYAFDTLRHCGELKANGALNPSSKIYEYYDSDGQRASFLDEDGEALPWSACVPVGGISTNLWKRPPLTTLDQLTALAHELKGTSLPRPLGRALQLAMDGSASPLETRIALFLTAGMRLGGEGWPKPRLNQHISFDTRATRLAHQGHCVADQLYPRTKGILEVNGEAFHSDDLTFKKETGRTAALESMGYRVITFTYDQVADLENYDSIIAQRAETLGMTLANRTTGFLKRRNELHGKLFPTGRRTV